MKHAIIWRKSIYDNGFKCRCGTVLKSNLPDTLPNDNCGFALPDMNTLYCRNCGQAVAVIRDYDGDKTDLAGEWEGDI